MRLWKRGIIAGLPFVILLWTTSVVKAHTVSGGGTGNGGGQLALGGTNGSSSYQETNLPGLTDASGGPVDATLATPNTDYPFGGFAQAGSGGASMQTGGALDFTTGSTFGGGSITLSYTVDFYFPTPFQGMTQSAVMNTFGDGSFSVADNNSNAEITAFSVSGNLYDQNGSLLSPNDGSTTLNLVSSPIQIPYNPNGSDANAVGPSGSGLTISNSINSSPFIIPGTVSSFDFQQTVTVTFSGLNANETVYVAFPNGGGIDPVPEPSSLSLLGIGACGLMGYAWRRWRGPRTMLALA